jgi:hypothetical protein
MVVRLPEHTPPCDDDCVTDNGMVRASFGNPAPLATTCAGPCYGLLAHAAWAARCPNCPHTEGCRIPLTRCDVAPTYIKVSATPWSNRFAFTNAPVLCKAHC